jgi:hypothetical protein
MSSTGSSHGRGGDAYGVFSNTGSTGGGVAMNFDSQSGLPASTWRPKGRNWTRQQKN